MAGLSGMVLNRSIMAILLGAAACHSSRKNKDAARMGQPAIEAGRPECNRFS
jgi:hypothetical protein